MNEQPEFCAGVRILIERMKTNPEDFDEGEYDLPSMRRKENKFSGVGKLLDEIVVNGKPEYRWKEWHYLSKEERSALIDAYKEMRRGQFDKLIMERVFDEKFYERQDEEAQMMKLQRMAMQPMVSQQTVQPGSVIATNTTGLSGLIGGFFR